MQPRLNSKLPLHEGKTSLNKMLQVLQALLELLKKWQVETMTNDKSRRTKPEHG